MEDEGMPWDAQLDCELHEQFEEQEHFFNNLFEESDDEY